MAQTTTSSQALARRHDGPALRLDDVLITAELAHRRARPSNLEAESRALQAIGRELATSCNDVLDALLRASLEICGAGSAGVSLLEVGADGVEQFRWVALVGEVADHIGRLIPRYESPCGVCLDYNSPQLFERPARLFRYLEPNNIVECLHYPFFAKNGRIVGVLWIFAHENGRRFDTEDVRIISSFADFAAFALARQSAEHDRERLHAAERCARSELAEACERLRNADMRKDEFLAMLGHELRNPLGAVANAVTLLENQTGGGPRTGRLIDVIRRQTRVMTQLLDDLLDVSRVTLGKIELRRRRIDLGRVVHQVVDGLTKEALAREHQLTIDIGESLFGIVDPTRLEQVASNLLTNAIKYTDRGGHISVTLRRDGDGAVLSVRDDGPGIAADFLPYVFDLFSQGGATTDRAQGGLGLGLTLVRRLVELHGGRVEVRSEGIGKGSEFLVRLPLADAEGATGADATGAVKAIVAPPRRLRVLVVDDDSDTAALSGEMLALLGHDPHVVNEPQAALDAAAATDWDLILLDIGLPGIDGYEVSRRLRAGRARKARLVAVSGFGGAPDRHRSFAAGCDEHLVKPLAVEDLREMLQRALAATPVT